MLTTGQGRPSSCVRVHIGGPWKFLYPNNTISGIKGKLKEIGNEVGVLRVLILYNKRNI